MHIKMAIRHFEHSFMNNRVYLLTLTCGLAIFYVFNSFPEQQTLLNIDRLTQHALLSLQEMINWLSVIVACLLGLINLYVNASLLQHRKKEIGIYLLLGMNEHVLSAKLLTETFGVSVIALFGGLIVGFLGSQFIFILTTKIFAAGLAHYHFVFSLSALYKCFLFFLVLVCLTLVLDYVAVRRSSLESLFNCHLPQKTWYNTYKKTGVLLFVFLGITVLSVTFLGNIKMTTDSFHLFALVGLEMMGIMLLLCSVPIIIDHFCKKNGLVNGKSLRIFYLRQIEVKFKSGILSLGIVTCLLTVTICIFFWGYTMQEALTEDLKSPTPYDFSLHFYSEDNFPLSQELPIELLDHRHIDGVAQLEIHIAENINENLFPIKETSDYPEASVALVGISDYNQAMRLADLPPLDLSPRRYAWASCADFSHEVEMFLKERTGVTILNGINLYPEDKADTWPITDDMNGVYMIVPDPVANSFPTKEKIINIKCKDPIAATEIKAEIENYQITTNPGSDTRQIFSYFDRNEIFESVTLSKVFVSILIIYLGFILMLACAAILMLKEMINIKDQFRYYHLMIRMGATYEEIIKVIFWQLFVVFSLPLTLATLCSFVSLITCKGLLPVYDWNMLMHGIVSTMVFVFILYAGFGLITFYVCKKLFQKEYII